MNIKMKSHRGHVNIDGRDFVGRSIVINGDKVIVDGVEQDGSLVGPVNVTVHGDAEVVESSSGSITIDGRCHSAKTASGDIQCGNISGSVSSMSGDVTCGSVGGSVSTMSGDVIHRERS